MGVEEGETLELGIGRGEGGFPGGGAGGGRHCLGVMLLLVLLLVLLVLVLPQLCAPLLLPCVCVWLEGQGEYGLLLQRVNKCCGGLKSDDD